MTVNTLVKEKELSDLYSYLKPYYEAGLDAVLVQDMGVFSYIRKTFPGSAGPHQHPDDRDREIQCAETLKGMGAVRVVPARELSLKEIREIRDDTGSGGGDLCPRGPLLLLFRPVPVFQPDRRAAAATGAGAPRPAVCPLTLEKGR